MLDVICLGELLIDFCSTKADISLEDAPAFAKAPGGAPANVAVGVAKLGRRAGFIGKVGHDPFGHFLAHTLEREGVDTSFLAFAENVRTTLSFVAVHSSGIRDCFFYRNPGADQMLEPDDIAETYVKAAKLFHFGSISMIDPRPKEATLKALETASSNGLLISYDPNLRMSLWPSEGQAFDTIWEGFSHADFAKVSEEEWEFITGTKDFDIGAGKIMASGVKLLVISQGERGATFCHRAGSQHVPGYEIELVEATGSGDGFVASILVDLVTRVDEGVQIEQLEAGDLSGIIKRANAVGALTATRYGAIPGLPTAQELEEFLLGRGE
jgi:fructokinase